MSRSKITPSGPLLRYADALGTTLVKQGYTPNTVAGHDKLLITLSGWLQARHLAPEQLTEEMIGGFKRWQRSSSRTRLNPEHGLSALVSYLRSVEAIPTTPPSPAGRVLSAYGDYLLVERRLAALTVVTRSDVIRRFLADRPATQDLDLAGLTVHDVHAFLLAEGSRLNVTSVGPVVDALRSFLRFLFVTGVLAHDLSGGYCRGSPPDGRHRYRGRQAPLPRSVDAATVTSLLDSCDRSTAVGLRYYAILTVLIRLGLRANEVAAMRLEDFDWRAGELTVHGKGGRTDRMPLATRTKNEHVRPSSQPVSP
jgi:integrase/recombinase XerD